MPTRRPPNSREGYDAENPNDSTRIGETWWDEDEEHMGEALSMTAKAEMDDQGDIAERDQKNLRAYKGRSYYSSNRLNAVFLAGQDGVSGPKATMNVTRAACNAVHSALCRGRPAAMFATEGGTRETRDKAKYLEKYSGGIHYQKKTYALLRRAKLDKIVLGSGVMYCAPNGDGDFDLERVFKPELLVDRYEGQSGNPRHTYRLLFIDKEKLAYDYPKVASKIRGLRGEWGEQNYLWWREESLKDNGMQTVVVGWHLPSKPDATDGVVAASVGDVLLFKKRWKWMHHPFAISRWTYVPDEFWGIGLPEEGQGLQKELNRLMQRIQHAMFLWSNPYILASKSSGIVRGQLANMPGSVILHAPGHEPKVIAPSVMSPEVYSQVDRIYDRFFELGGVSKNTVAASIPARMESGRAQEILKDSQSERFVSAEQDDDEQFLELTELAILSAKEVNYQVKVFDRNEGFEPMDWKKIDLERDAWVMRLKPISLLSKDPAAKREEVERLIGMGLITDPVTQIEALDDADLEKLMSRELAPRRYTERIIEQMLKGERPWEAPDPALPMIEVLKTARAMYVELLAENAADGEAGQNLTKLANWILAADGVRKEQEKAMAPAAQGLPPGMALPPGALPPTPPGVAPPGVPPPGAMGLPPGMPPMGAPPGMPPPGMPPGMPPMQ